MKTFNIILPVPKKRDVSQILQSWPKVEFNISVYSYIRLVSLLHISNNKMYKHGREINGKKMMAKVFAKHHIQPIDKDGSLAPNELFTDLDTLHLNFCHKIQVYSQRSQWLMKPPRLHSKKNGFRKNRWMVTTTYKESYGKKQLIPTLERNQWKDGKAEQWESLEAEAKGQGPSQQERRADTWAVWTNHPTNVALQAASLCTKTGHCFPISNWRLVFTDLSLYVFGHRNASRQRRYCWSKPSCDLRDIPGLQAHGSSICLVSCNGGHWCNERLMYLEINVNYNSFVLHRDVEENDNWSDT